MILIEALIFIFSSCYLGQSDVYENGSSGDNNSDDWMFDMNRKSRDSEELTNPLEKSNGLWTNSSGYVYIKYGLSTHARLDIGDYSIATIYNYM